MLELFFERPDEVIAHAPLCTGLYQLTDGIAVPRLLRSASLLPSSITFRVGAEGTAVAHHVAHEIQRPYAVDGFVRHQRLPLPCHHSFLGLALNFDFLISLSCPQRKSLFFSLYIVYGILNTY